ncbi:MAG: sodium:solute symporter [Ignavibacteriaceae bacterium]|nr:sodium:solute symporter [Ignavibacteriaceae bacterium]NUM71582.1 sodium:solute symporter [Ignavibacteriaceae bacterium]
MSITDWIVLTGFTLFIVAYGIIKSRKSSSTIDGYLLADKQSPWYVVTFSVMATQASAITFISTPGQAFDDGMRFLQFYLGLPIAMVLISHTAVPLFHKLRVFTAYEFLESRFDVKSRFFTAGLFLIQRGLAAAFTIYAPALVLSVLLGSDLHLTIIAIGVLTAVYTISGGSDAVNKTQLLQFTIIFIGMLAALITIFIMVGDFVNPLQAVKLAGLSGKMNMMDFSFNLVDRYNFWSGIIGGTFLALSYFGTDQSQVARYLSGKSVNQTRFGLLMNGILKIPMQVGILFIGVMVFVFYQFVLPPLHFNPVTTAEIKNERKFSELEAEHKALHGKKLEMIKGYLNEGNIGDDEFREGMQKFTSEGKKIESSVGELIKSKKPDAPVNDINYIFLSFVLNFLPVGLIGLVIACVLAASMSSTSSELNALASTSVIDFYKRTIKKDAGDAHYLKVSKIATLFWAVFAIAFAEIANKMGSLVEAVNVLGSLFYGAILGIFVIAFYLKKIRGTAAFYGGITGEAVVLILFFGSGIPFLWLNFIGCMTVVISASVIQKILEYIKR